MICGSWLGGCSSGWTGGGDFARCGFGIENRQMLRGIQFVPKYTNPITCFVPKTRTCNLNALVPTADPGTNRETFFANPLRAGGHEGPAPASR